MTVVDISLCDTYLFDTELEDIVDIEAAYSESKFCPVVLSNSEKGIVISDLHIPYHKIDILKKVLHDADGYRDFCVIAGDYLDQKCMSKFPKDNETLLEDEYNCGLNILNTIKKNFEKVYVIMGNHDARTKTALMRDGKFLKLAFMCIPDPLFYLTKGIAFKDGIPTTQYDFSNVNYFCSRDLQLGDVIFCHPNTYSRTNGKTVELTIEYYLRHRKTFNAVVIGHTHNSIKVPYLGKTGYEIGCMCYDLLPSAENMRASLPINAYLRLSYNNGCYVHSETTLIDLE